MTVSATNEANADYTVISIHKHKRTCVPAHLTNIRSVFSKTVPVIHIPDRLLFMPCAAGQLLPACTSGQADVSRAYIVSPEYQTNTKGEDVSTHSSFTSSLRG